MRLLKLKIELLKSSKHYLVDIVPHGKIFDANTMVPVNSAGTIIQDDRAEWKRVQICLFPGLVEHDWPLPLREGATQLEIDEVILKATVDGKQFFSSNDRPQTNSIVIAKALVILAESVETGDATVGSWEYGLSETNSRQEQLHRTDQCAKESERNLVLAS
jgi:hypothetical protein